MGSHKYRHSFGCSLVNQLPKLTACHRINPTGRLIQKHHLGTMNRRHGKSQLLFPAQRQFAYKRVDFGTELQPVKQLDCPTQRPVTGQTVNTGIQADILPNRQILIQRKALTHISDTTFDQFSLRHHVIAGHSTTSRCGVTQPAEHTHSGGFTSPVGPQKAKDLSP